MKKAFPSASKAIDVNGKGRALMGLQIVDQIL